MKPAFTFHWLHRPHDKSIEERGAVAKLFRAYRKDKAKYNFHMVEPGRYFVSLHGYGAVGVFAKKSTN
jgi:diaminopimelate decarboxylase